MRRAVLVVPILLGLLAAAGAEAAPRTLVLDMQLVDTSGEGALPGHPARREKATEALRQGLAEAGYEVIDQASVHDLIPPDLGVSNCNGCEIDIARKAGAELVVTGHVHKVSTLILSLTLEVESVANGQPVAVGVADIRGDNDRAWVQGVQWLVRHRLVPGLALYQKR